MHKSISFTLNFWDTCNCDIHIWISPSGYAKLSALNQIVEYLKYLRFQDNCLTN